MEKERQESKRDQENGGGERDGKNKWGVGNEQFYKVKQGRQLASNGVLCWVYMTIYRLTI